MDKDEINCGDCMKKIVRGLITSPSDEPAYYCDSCGRHYCSECGFYDENDDLFLCNSCWYNKTKGLINNERFIEAAWIFKKLGKSKEHEEVKKMEEERRKRLGIKEGVVDRTGNYIGKEK